MEYSHTDTDLPIESQFPKLVRDRIPEIIARGGTSASTHIASDAEYVHHLLRKLIEEATELSRAEPGSHQIEELADVQEVIAAPMEALDVSRAEIEEVRASKCAERGGFGDRTILDSITE